MHLPLLPLQDPIYGQSHTCHRNHHNDKSMGLEHTFWLLSNLIGHVQGPKSRRN